MVRVVWIGMVMTVACGRTQPTAHHGLDGSPDVPQPDVTLPGACSDCELTALEPAIAHTGDTITLEGTFRPPVTVTFPGGATAAATVLGPNRITVQVPATATTGGLTVASDGATLGPLPFRRASFDLGLGEFEHYEQVAVAREQPMTAVRVCSQGNVLLGNNLYLIGGRIGSAVTTSVQRATVHADGTTNTFATVSGSTLVDARDGFVTLVTPSWVYVVGGYNGLPMASVERAPIAADGTLGTFAIDPSVTLATARGFAASAVIGPYLYVFGGNISGPAASVERATILPDGTLGPFTAMPDGLTEARADMTATVIGPYVYIISGWAGGSYADPSVERAPIMADGSLGAFAIVAGVSLVTGRFDHTATVYGGQLYIVGGLPGTNFLTRVERATIHDDGTIDTFAEIPVDLAAERGGHGTLILGNDLYVVGGCDTNGPVPPDKQVERATIHGAGALGTLATATATALATPRADHATVALGSYVYAIGGTSGGTSLGSVERATVAPDGSLGPFSTVGVSLVTPRSSFATAIVRDSLYVIGGQTDAGLTASVERAPIMADGTLGAFQTAAAIALATPRKGGTATILGGFPSNEYLYVIGGEGSAGPLATIEQAPIDPSTAVMGTFAIFNGITMQTARSRHTIAALKQAFLYVHGGVGASGALATVERAPINGNAPGTFTTIAADALHTARGGHASTVVGSELYVVGGLGSATLDDAEHATIATDGTLGAFAAVAGVLASARTGASLLVLGNFTYLIGGTTSSGTTSEVLQAVLP